ncbi:MAG: PKD-like domain-containing protein, partial [Empedobacter falsenii]
MNYSKILLSVLGLALIQSCNDDENIIEANPDNVTLQASYDATRLKIIPIEPTLSGFENATFTWKLGNEIIGTEKVLGFVSDKAGAYDLTLEIKSITTTKTAKTKINVQQETKTYSKYIAQVFDYLPSIGQFVNKLPAFADGDKKSDMTAKAAKALVGEKSTMITLGGYGGYVVFGFDHTIMNQPNKRDFKVLGNGFAGSSEPGIVMVAYDKNKNGKPDEDEWYEIAGSEYTNPNTIKNYTITYTKPDENKTPVKGTIGWQTDIEYIKWSDNQGNSGYKTKNSYHKQSYYPLWFGSDQLKFTGTLLPNNYTDQSGNGTY